MRATAGLFSVLALAACSATGAVPAPEPAAVAAPAEPSPRVVVGIGEAGETVAFVSAVSPTAADRARKGLLGLYARIAEGEGDWGFRVAPAWREETPEHAIAAIGQSGSPEAIEEFMGGERAYFLDVTYLEGPVANDDGNVYAAAELIPPGAALPPGEEN